MATRIAFFNHKGGVSKTTTVFHVGWMLAKLGKRVVLVDADPQCNLTGQILGYKGPNELEGFYERAPEKNIYAALAPTFASRLKLIEPIDCVAVRDGLPLFLLPGHIRFAEFDVPLGMAHEVSASLPALQNLPGAFSFLLEKIAHHHRADFLLVDMGPSLNSINQNIVMTSDFFIVPTAPDFYDVMAIDSLSSIIPRWHGWASRASALPLFRDASYPFPNTVPKLLGVIVQKYRVRNNEPSRGFQNWIDQILGSVSSKLAPLLRNQGMLLPEDAYTSNGIERYCLAQIPDFNSLIAKSQQHRTPIFELTKAQLGVTGPVLERALDDQLEFKELFETLGQKIIRLVNYAPTHPSIPGTL